MSERYVIKFSKGGYAKYTSHLDLLRFFKRAFRKTGVDLKYSQGFNPHPKLSFAQPLSLGYLGDNELVEFETNTCQDPVELENILNNANIEYDKTIDTSEDGDKKSISTEFRIKNSSGYSMSYVKCEDGKVVAIKWVVEE